MAVNRTRDLTEELNLGLTENSYMRLTPNRGGLIEHPRAERLSWPTYARVEMHNEDTMNEVPLNPSPAEVERYVKGDYPSHWVIE